VGSGTDSHQVHGERSGKHGDALIAAYRSLAELPSLVRLAGASITGMVIAPAVGGWAFGVSPRLVWFGAAGLTPAGCRGSADRARPRSMHSDRTADRNVKIMNP
jgi:hypothetical protein